MSVRWEVTPEGNDFAIKYDQEKEDAMTMKEWARECEQEITDRVEAAQPEIEYIGPAKDIVSFPEAMVAMEDVLLRSASLKLTSYEVKALEVVHDMASVYHRMVLRKQIQELQQELDGFPSF